jgi:predicted patatin/cPLA2 family phospholipase
LSYRSAIEFMAAPPRDCSIVQVAPASMLATGRTTQDARALELDFALGREAGKGAIRAWLARDLARSAGPSAVAVGS